jgi:transcriptional regulator with XRE-family HTH domain
MMSDDIAIRLQKVRQMYGFSQRELAKRAGVTNSSVSMIEQGRVSPSISSLEKLLKNIPMTLKDFFSFDPCSETQYFYRNHEIPQTHQPGIDHFHLASKSKEDHKTLSYSTYQPNSSNGDSMLTASVDLTGFIVQGELEVTINNQSDCLKQGDGFCICSLSPYRFRNTSAEPAIIVVTS